MLEVLNLEDTTKYCWKKLFIGIDAFNNFVRVR